MSGTIAAYSLDTAGNPIPGTRRAFFSGPPFRAPQGVAFDRISGDLLVSTRLNSGSAIYRISGFNSGPGVGFSSLSQCMEITTPGHFTLTVNLTDTQGGGCVKIHDTYNVEIECNNLTIFGRPAISVANVNGFVIRNCRLEGPSGTGIAVSNSGRGEIVKNTIGSLAALHLSTVDFYAVRSTVLSDNTIFGAFQHHRSTGTSILPNRFTAPRPTSSPLLPGLILSDGSLNVQSMPFTLSIESNVLDGQSSPTNTTTGVQTGILLADGKKLNVSGNQIRNTILAAIMTSGNIVESNFSGNTIDTTEYAISGRSSNSWTNVRVAGNHVSNVLGLFVLTRTFGLRPANWDGQGASADKGVYFQGNSFSGNRLTPGPSPAEHATTLPIFDLLRGYQIKRL
ncbi:MAG TPA: right-handed parallel beta-helix repeat-containing protein [Bryobacteraceae bacterium]|nr:right-handed parallel beta-helix repeat-containing protein [Bryobacteraceae bacterium]